MQERGGRTISLPVITRLLAFFTVFHNLAAGLGAVCVSGDRFAVTFDAAVDALCGLVSFSFGARLCRTLSHRHGHGKYESRQRQQINQLFHEKPP